MEKEKLIKYLKDIIELETQKRIAISTYQKLSVIEKDYMYVNYIPEEEFCTVSKEESSSFMGKLSKFGIGQKQEMKLQYIENAKRGKIILGQIQGDKTNISNAYEQCEQSLKKLYALNIIHPNYQYLEACGMFLQYLSTGRTHCLEQRGGDVGAYNLYENDLKFEVIRKQLNQVLKNQQILYGVLTQINNNVEGLCSSLGSIEQYVQQTAKNTKISAWCNIVTTINMYALRRMQEEYIFYR